MKVKIAVVGGCNIDISATSYTPILFQDSNPGTLKTTLGGVGRNIAENLTRLGHSVYLVSMLGNDQFKREIEDKSNAIGLDLSCCEIVNDAQTSTYICVNQPDGDIAVAVSAMDICEGLTPEVLKRKLAFLNTCDYVVIDSNIPEESVRFLADNCTARLCADTVSVKKAAKLKPVLSKLFFLKANRAEAEILTGFKLDGVRVIESAAAQLHEIGVQNVAITLSMEGAYLSNGSQKALAMPYASAAVNTTGCGDAFFAGVLTALTEQLDVKSAISYGLAAAAISAEADSAVSPILTHDVLLSTLNRLQGGVNL